MRKSKRLSTMRPVPPSAVAGPVQKPRALICQLRLGPPSAPTRAGISSSVVHRASPRVANTRCSPSSSSVRLVGRERTLLPSTTPSIPKTKRSRRPSDCSGPASVTRRPRPSGRGPPAQCISASRQLRSRSSAPRSRARRKPRPLLVQPRWVDASARIASLAVPEGSACAWAIAASRPAPLGAIANSATANTATASGGPIQRRAIMIGWRRSRT